MRTIFANLVNENGDQLVDELGNELVAQFQVTDYALSARTSQRLLHGYKSTGSYNAVSLTFTLVDESGNILTDESDNELIAKIGVSSRMLHAKATNTLLHGG